MFTLISMAPGADIQNKKIYANIIMHPYLKLQNEN